MKITKKKLLEIIKEEVSDVSLKDDKGMEYVLAGLLSSDKKRSLAALTRLTMVDKKVQYLDQEVKKLKNQQTGDINVASGRPRPVKEESGAKTPMKISKKYLQKIIKEEVQAAILEQGKSPTPMEWLTKYPQAVQLVHKNREKLGFSNSDDHQAIADFLGGESGLVITGDRKRLANSFLYSYEKERSGFLNYVKDVKASQDEADAAAQARVGNVPTQADMDQAAKRARDREASRPKKIEVVFSSLALLPGDDPLQGARRKAAEKANLTLPQYTQQYTDKVITKTEGTGIFTMDVKTLVATRKDL